MTQQFHAGQEVEVHYPFSRSNEATWPWVKAKIVAGPLGSEDLYQVQFHDSTRAVFDASHIRADTTLRVSSNDPMGTRPMTLDETLDYKAALAEAHDEALQAEGKP